MALNELVGDLDWRSMIIDLGMERGGVEGERGYLGYEIMTLTLIT
jgi:hypothetical protein